MATIRLVPSTLANANSQLTITGGSDGTYIIKVFGQASENDLWSA